jgi:RsiW-degrading membrane proteinase PrsW (M82 family)
LDNWFRIYAWFLLLVTALPAFARLARPRELAQIMLLRYQNSKRRKRARIGGAIYLALALLATPFLLRSPLHQQRWLVIALLVGAVSAVEFVMNSRVFEVEDLTSQNRYFGGVYAAIAIAVALLLITR